MDAQVKPPLVMELQPPVLSNNWGNLSESCMLDDTFKALVRPIVVSLHCRFHCLAQIQEVAVHYDGK